jgi:hypothetical protein
VGIRNFSLHFWNSSVIRSSESVAELMTKKCCETAIVDLQNLTSAIPQLSIAKMPDGEKNAGYPTASFATF